MLATRPQRTTKPTAQRRAVPARRDRGSSRKSENFPFYAIEFAGARTLLAATASHGGCNPGGVAGLGDAMRRAR
jgi:hypothetical protein